MAQQSKFGGALSIGKQAIAQEASDRSDVAPAAPEPPPKQEPLYSDDELKQVNAGGLKVALAVRKHWMLQAHVEGVSLASLIKPVLIEKLGLPEGFTPDNLSAPSE